MQRARAQALNSVTNERHGILNLLVRAARVSSGANAGGFGLVGRPFSQPLRAATG